MSMNLKSLYRRRVLQNTMIVATTVFTCGALQANDNDQNPANAGAPGQYERSDKQHGAQHGDQAQHFIKEAAMGGKMEVQMGQLAEQRGQSQDVKTLGQTLVRDHTMANQKLEQIAQQKGVTLDKGAGDQKHQHQLQKLQSHSGAEFDKAFVQNAIKDHKKDIAEFERAEKNLQDEQLRGFINETLPKLRNHLQMAQNAARTLGVTVSDTDTYSSGAPATGERGTEDKSDSDSSSLEKPQANINSPDASLQANVGDTSVRADADVNTTDESSTRTDLKGDHKVLGLSTDKNDGKILGIIPIPGKNDSTSASTSSSSDTAVGGPAISTSGTSSSSERVDLSTTPSAVRQALKTEGADNNTTVKRMTVYEANVNGKTIHVTEQGKVYTHDQNDNSSSNR